MQRAGWTVLDVIVSLGRPHQQARRRAEAEEAAARAGFEPIFLDPPPGIYRKYRFVLVAANGEPVATSETYESKSGAKRGAEACKRAAAEAEIVDETD